MSKDWQVEASKLLVSLEKASSKLQAISAKFENESDAAIRVITSMERQIKKHDKVLDALRNENEVLTNITVPALTAACKLGLERWDAETAIQVRRQASMLPVKEE